MAKAGSSQLAGAITLTGGTNITLTQSGQDISIAAAGAPISIGATVTSGTAGSILFVGAGPVLSQDNANLFWDDTNNRLGVGTASPASTIEAMCTASTEIGLIIQAAAAQSADLTRWLDSSGNSLLEVNSDGTVTYAPTNATVTSPTYFSSTSTLTTAGGVPIFFKSGNTVIYTSSPGFGLPPFFFAFQAQFRAQTNNITMFQPIAFYAAHSHVADGVVWTGGNAGGVASFVDNSTYSTANSGSYTTYTHNGFKSALTINSGTIAARNAIYIDNATGAGTLTDQIGINIQSLTKGATSNVAIRTGVGGVIEIGNLITKYNNIATVSNGVPSELATVDLATQAAAIAATTVYTPAATGLFRISIYLQVTRAATTSSILGGATGVVITYNDGDGNVAQSNTAALATTTGTIAVTAAGNTTATNLEGSMVIYARTGVAIQYAVGYTSVGVTSMQFAIHLKVESL